MGSTTPDDRTGQSSDDAVKAEYAALLTMAAAGDHEAMERLLIRAREIAYWMIVVMREMEGLSTREMAAVTGISEANVKTRLHRAHTMLRRQLDDL